MALFYVPAYNGVTSVEELYSLGIETGLTMIGCQMTVDLFDFDAPDFIDGVEFGCASVFLGFAGDTDINLFI